MSDLAEVKLRNIQEVYMDYKENFIKIIGAEYYKKFTEEIDETKYVVNPLKAEKLIDVLKYCQKLANDNDAKIEYCVTKSKKQPAELSIRFESDLVFGDGENNLQDFISALDSCDGININGTGLSDGSFLISFFVDNLYILKHK